MDRYTVDDYRDNPDLVRRLGIEALTRELGPEGMFYFMRLFGNGHGDYTEDRHAILKDLTFEDIDRQLERMRKPDGSGTK